MYEQLKFIMSETHAIAQQNLKLLYIVLIIL